MVTALVEQARTGDADAFSRLSREIGDRLYAVALKVLRDREAAQDAVQNTLIDAWRSLPGLRQAESFDSWIYRSLVRNCYREARASTRLRQRLGPSERSAPDTQSTLADRDAIERMLRRLPVQQRTILVLRHYLGMEPTELAAVLGIPAGTARSRLHYAHQQARAALEAEARTDR